MADSVLHASSRHMAPAAATSASLRVATDSHEREEIQSETQCADSATTDTVALHAVKSMPHVEHFALLAPLRFDNDSHWCYTNAALAAWMWSTLSHHDYDFSQWGTMQNCVANLLTHNKQQISDNCINLRNFFPELFQRWQQDCRQGDAAEFTSLLLETAKQSCVNQSWEQRLLVHNSTGFQITVHGEAWAPLNLAPSHESSDNLNLLFFCERLSASMARSLHLKFSLCTTSDSRPGPGGVEPRLAVSLRPEGHRQYHHTTDAP